MFNIAQINCLPVTAAQVAKTTQSDPVLSKILQFVKQGWPMEVSENLKPYKSRSNELTVQGSCLLWGIRVIVPEKLRGDVLKELHSSHPGISRMKGIARSYVWWPGLDKNIEDMVKACTECQSVKETPPLAPLHPWIWPSRPWERIHVDFAGPFLGKMYFIIVDAHSKWPEVFEMPSTSAEQTVCTLRNLFASYGLPLQLVSDNGPQFVSSCFEQFMKVNGIKHIRCAPYHPSSNGLAERFVRSFKEALKTGNTSGISSTQRLANFLLSYRSSPHATTGCSPSSLFLKRDLRTRMDLLKPNCHDQVVQSQSSQSIHHDQHARGRELDIGQAVMIRDFRGRLKWVPGRIIHKNGPLTYLVKTQTGLTWRRHVDHIKERLDNSLFEVPENHTESNAFTDLPVPQSTEPTSSADSTRCPQQTSFADRYPIRTRHPPDRYGSVSNTN